jgi:pimeloyl-ACP methyl ester carboxylesterase
MTNDIKPFTINIPQSDLDDLKQRLANTRWPDRETPDDWSQGIPLSYTQEICRYWQSDYDWRRCETLLNEYPQFKTEIDGVRIHFLHVRSPEPNALPLIMTHGWPGSVLEFIKVIGPLTDPVAHGGKAEDAFHVVVPALPGFGFSGKPTTPGWGVEKIGDAWAQLMARLGYNGYVAQGGDWGARITQMIGAHDPDHCRAIHLNMVTAPPHMGDPKNPTPREQDALDGLKHYKDWDTGYSIQQGTRPQTLGYALVDSPVGQAAWIIEKFWSWMDCDGHPENVLSKDELLDNVMLYWLPATGASSARIYWQSFGKSSNPKVNVPMGGSVFPKDIFRPTREWAEEVFLNIVYWNEPDSGGHFAAMEKPGILVTDMRKTFATIR